MRHPRMFFVAITVTAITWAAAWIIIEDLPLRNARTLAKLRKAGKI